MKVAIVTLDEYTIDPKKRGALILALRRAIVSEFTVEDWREFGYLSGHSDYIQRHDRLLRSLHWQDPDYGDCVLQALERFTREGWDVVDQLINHPKLTSHLLKDIPDLLTFVRREIQSVKTEAPASLSSGGVVLTALCISAAQSAQSTACIRRCMAISEACAPTPASAWLTMPH